MRGVRVHRPTVRGRLRTDAGLLVLTGLVVALASALLAAVWPLTVRAADEATADSVRAAGPGGSLVATLPQSDVRGERRRDADAIERFELDTKFTGNALPERLAAVVRPGVASYVSAALSVEGPGPSRTLRLVYAASPTEPPAVTWEAGREPASTAGPGEESVVLAYGEPPWPVEVGLSERVASALGVRPGDRLRLADQYAEPIVVRVTGIFSADDPTDRAWAVARELLSPAAGTFEGVETTSGAALVSPEGLADLRIAVPADRLVHQVGFVADAERFRWEEIAGLRQDVVELKARPGTASGQTGWDGALDRVLGDAAARVADARGQAQVPLVGLLASTAATVVLAALLLARRRAGPLTLARERGATLVGIGVELALESLLVAVVGAAVGVGVIAALLGSVSLSWVLPLVVVAVLAEPLLGAVEAARATSARRVPANRAARRLAVRRRQVRRVVLEAGLVALAALTHVALEQRGPVVGDLATATSPLLWSVVGALVLVRVLPPLVRLLLRRSGRSAGLVPFFVAARVAAGGLRALPLVVVVVAVAQLTFASSLAGTQHRGQETGALLSVGGDARLASLPEPSVAERAAAIGQEPGVDVVVAGRVADGTLASSVSTGASVRLVVVGALAYRQLLAASELPDAPQLDRLTASGGEDAPVPALLLGGPDGLENGLSVRWGEDDVALDVVGEAPRVDASTEPVIVVDAAAFAATGAIAHPDTVWAVGPGAADALRAAAAENPADAVQTYDDVLTRLREAPLAAALVDLAVAASLLLVLLAGLGVVLGAAVDAPARATALGRLHSLGLTDRELRRVLTGELLAPVLASALTGLALGLLAAWATLGPLGLETVTGQTETPSLAVPLWTWLAVLALPATALVLASRQGRQMRQADLARLLRSGDR